MVIAADMFRSVPTCRPLGEIVEFLDHARRPITARDRVWGAVPYYGANGVQDHVDGYLFDEPLVLLAEDGGRFDEPERGIAYAIEGRSWVNNHAHVLRPADDVDLRYLTRVLENYDVGPFLTGSTRLKLTKSSAMRIPIPLPGIEEQRRIAGVLDAADALRAKRREAIAKLDTLTQAIFIDMFGDLASPSFRATSVADVLVAELRNGVSPSKSGQSTGSVLTLSAITGPAFEPGAVKASTFSRPHLPEKLVSDRDFLICRGNGNVALVGRGKFPDGRVDDGTAFPDTMIAACFDPDRVARGFLTTLWDQDLIRSQIERKARTTNGTFKINQSMIESIELPLPPIEMQRRFERAIETVNSHRLSLSRSLDGLDTLFASLQQRAFRGEL